MTSSLQEPFLQSANASGLSPSLVDDARVLTLEPKPSSRLVFLTDPSGLAVEQYKILGRRLLTSHPQGGILMTTSAGPGEGKTLTSINLSWTLEQSGQRTCLVDLDLRAPGVVRALGCPAPRRGVEDVLEGSRKVQECLYQIAGTRLHVLPVRRRRKVVGSLLSPALLKPMLDELRSMFDWIILDYAPAIPMADVGDGMCNVDGALLVVRAGKTSKRVLAPVLDILGTKNWGVVLNDAAILGSAYYGSYGKGHE